MIWKSAVLLSLPAALAQTGCFASLPGPDFSTDAGSTDGTVATKRRPSGDAARDHAAAHEAGKADAPHGRDATVPRDAGGTDALGIADAATDSAGACMPGTVRDAGGCAMCGTSLETCNPAHQWDPPVCESHGGVCNPDAQAAEPCGSCGTQTQTCLGNCTWGAFGSCEGQGVCAPGTQQCCNFNVSPADCCVSPLGSSQCGANESTCTPCAANGGAWDFYVCSASCTWFDCTQAGCGNALCGS